MDKENYLGSVNPIPKDHVKQEEFDVNKLLTLKHENSVINIQCANCLVVMEGEQENAEALAKAAGIELPEDLSGKYFVTSSCILCNTGDEIIVGMKDIKELAN